MIDLQPEIQWFMRPFLLDFLIELHLLFKLQPLTLFLCLNIIDRYCAKRIVFKRHYQLVGCTALWIAGKYEDKKSRVPTLKELSVMCRNAYDEEMFIQMEMHILATLEWSLSHPNLEECLQLAIAASNITQGTPCKYNRANSTSSAATGSSRALAVTAVGRFLCELSMYDKYFMLVPTSLVATTANLLACLMLNVLNASIALGDAFRTYREDCNDHFDDEDAENIQPPVEGLFLSGFDGDATLEQIRRVALMLIIQITKVTEVLSKKYDALGVVQVVSNFNSRTSFTISTILEHQELIVESETAQLNPKLAQLADAVLQLPSYNEPLARPLHYSSVPMTPPSATSQYSLFSQNHATPVHSSAYSQSSDSINGYSSPVVGVATHAGGFHAPHVPYVGNGHSSSSDTVWLLSPNMHMHV